MKKITFTLNDLKKWNIYNHAYNTYKNLTKALGGEAAYGMDTPINLSQAFDSNGLDDCIWIAQRLIDRNPGHPLERDLIQFACDCAERVLPIFEKPYPEDDRPRRCIEITRQYARGAATKDAAMDAAKTAAWAAKDPNNDGVDIDVAWAAYMAATAAAWAVTDAAKAANLAVGAADAANLASEKQWQDQKFRKLLESYS